jgi:hypothetical protein
MATTRQYLHLAGVTFAEKAAALEAHFSAVELSTRLCRSHPTPQYPNRVRPRLSISADLPFSKRWL